MHSYQAPLGVRSRWLWVKGQLALYNGDNTLESATQLTILPSPNRISPVTPRENRSGSQHGAHTEKPIPATSHTYQMPVTQGEAMPRSSQRPQVAPPTSPFIITQRRSSNHRSVGVAEEMAHRLGTPRCHSWLQWGIPYGGARDSSMIASGAPLHHSHLPEHIKGLSPRRTRHGDFYW